MEPKGGRDVWLERSRGFAKKHPRYDPGRTAGGVLQTLRHLSATENLKPCRMQRLTKDGRIVEVRVTVAALMDESRNPYAIVTTERREREQGHASKPHPDK